MFGTGAHPAVNSCVLAYAGMHACAQVHMHLLLLCGKGIFSKIAHYIVN